ncbi:alpha/beta hydrolase [Belliella sp. R4-6]|uniref:Alpha/beta hydrolase n=1 Tax=Belliella alkalica TaxID=1730871 RepID=A0ABS9VH65_9BACT|nr:alpha/beta hydrolase [Belliella alkalica]MCH7415494.1 alpha/beta hydrolase [Belliella alkalica]
MQNKITLHLILVSILLTFACSESEEPSLNLDASVAVEIKDDPYGNHPRQVLDVYLPANRSKEKTKLFVWIHGGAWTDGDKSEFAQIKPLLESLFEDYAFVSVNYRLFNITTTSNRFPNQEEDIQSMLNYVKSRLNAWDLSDDVVLAGGSAGGHLALLHSYKNNGDGLVKATVAFFPPTDFKAFHGFNFLTTALIEALIGGSPSNKPSGYANASPVNYINSSSVPTAFFHGTADNVVPITQSYILEEKLKKNNVPYLREYVQGAGHSFSQSVTIDLVGKTAAFLKVHVP